MTRLVPKPKLGKALVCGAPLRPGGFVHLRPFPKKILSLKTPALLLLAAVTSLVPARLYAAIDTKPPSPSELEFFEKKIRPVLVSSCYKCHSTEGEKIKANLLVDTREGLLKGGDSGPAIVPGDPNKSLLIKTIRHEDSDPDLAMPPKADKLSDEVIADFEKWVKLGAPDPRVAKAAPVYKTWDMAKLRKEHWSFRPISKPEVPNPKDPQVFVQTPIDAFVLAKLQEKGLKPSKMVDKRDLLRRATYDLTGLPPTPEEVDEFLNDDSTDAFAKVVDRLLASPRYGERWGRHWLDIARYADTSGDRQNGKRTMPLYPYAWTYRDYVIEAFNNDLPYDQFIVQQIAADRLPDAEKDKSVLPALGFLTVGKRFMGNPNDVIDDQIDAVTKGLMGITGACARCHDHKFDPIPTKDYYSLHGVFSSSREPKEEPLLEDPEQDPDYKDFLKEVAKVEAEVVQYEQTYAAHLLSGMLDKAGEYMLIAHESGKNVPDGKKKGGTFRLAARQKGLEAELAVIWVEDLKAISGKKDPVFGPWFRFAALSPAEFTEKAPELAAEIAAAKETEVHPLLAKAIAEKQPSSISDVAAIYTDLFGKLRQAMDLKPFALRRGGAGKASTEEDKTNHRLADADMESLRLHIFGPDSPIKPDTQKMARAFGNQFTNPEEAIRGKIVKLEMVHPGSPARAMALEDMPKAKDSAVLIRGEAGNRGPVVPRQFLELLAGDSRKPFTDGSGRLELAKAVASPSNPLTARVIVNRVWQWHFGQAIVRTVSDFGTRSEPPTHPELLDYLASTFMENGWSIKKLHRQIMLSSVYQQDSRSEKNAMKVDPTNQWLWRFNIQRLDLEEIRDSLLTFGGKLDLTMGGPPVQLINDDRAGRYKSMTVDFKVPEEKQNRRTVYGMIDRSALPDVFNTFDFANPDMSTGERLLTTVPQQALFLMNSPFIVQQVKNLLARHDFPSDAAPDEKVRFIYRTLFQRAPSDAEMQMAAAFVSAEDSAGQPGSLLAATNGAQPTGSEASSRAKKQDGNRKDEPSQKLNAWERYTQVMMLANETVFIN